MIDGKTGGINPKKTGKESFQTPRHSHATATQAYTHQKRREERFQERMIGKVINQCVELVHLHNRPLSSQWTALSKGFFNSVE